MGQRVDQVVELPMWMWAKVEVRNHSGNYVRMIAYPFLALWPPQAVSKQYFV